MSIIYSIIIWPLFIFSTVVLCVLGYPSVLFGKQKIVYKYIARIWARVSLILFAVFYKVEGVEKLDKDTHYVFLGNHQSYVDIFLMITVIPQHFLFMAKKELFKIPFFGRAISYMGLIPVDRGESKEALKSLLQAVKLIKTGYSVLLFPEGTRSYDGKLLPFKRGAFMIGVKTKHQIAPFVIKNTTKSLKKGTGLIRPFQRCSVTFLDPIEVGDLKENSLIDQVREAMLKELGQYPEQRETKEEKTA